MYDVICMSSVMTYDIITDNPSKNTSLEIKSNDSNKTNIRG